MVLDISWNRTTIEDGHKGVTLVHLCALFMGTTNCFLNLVIWVTFHKSSLLLQKHHLYLFYMFAVTNFFSGFFTIPTYINLIYRNNLNCPRWSILIGSSFEIACDRIRHIVTLSIACERNYALFRPGDYFFLDHRMVALKVFIISLVWGIFDMLFLIFEDDIHIIRVHCVTTSSSGPLFHLYFLISTIAFGVLLCFSYFTFICKLYIVRGTVFINQKSRSRENYQQANSLTVIVILLVIIFNVLPSTLYLYDMIIGEVHFMKWGPIITIGYHCYGTLSFFFYNWRHREIRSALNETVFIRRFVNCNQEACEKSITIWYQPDISSIIKNVPILKSSHLINSKQEMSITNSGNDSEIFL